MSALAGDFSPSHQPARALSLVEAMSVARRSVALYTELPVDAVASCEMADGHWRVTVDVIEAAARMGENDMLATFEVIMTPHGEVTRYGRLGRYHRTAAARAGR